MPQRRSRLGSSVVLPVLAADGGTVAPRLGHKGNPAIIFSGRHRKRLGITECLHRHIRHTRIYNQNW